MTPATRPTRPTQATTPETAAATRARSRAASAPRSAAGGGALELTLDPVGAATFFAEHWERRPLVVPRAESTRFDALLSRADVERLICTTGIRAPAFRLVKDGAQLPLRSYTQDIPWRPGSFSGAAVVSRVAEEFERGATIVLQGLHLHWLAAAVYCRGLEAHLGCPVQANAYYTPASARGFSVHHDTHDVFVLQAAGRKRWRVYDPVLELPLKGQRWSAQLGEVGEPVAEFVLEAGDTLYLPRGWPHEASAGDADSLHLTIGVHALSRLDALRAALDSCADGAEFRRSVASDGEIPGQLLERLDARLGAEQVARRMRRRFVSSRRPILDDQLAQVRALVHLTLAHELERRRTVIADLELAEAGATLLFEGKEVALPRQARAAVEWIYARDRPFTLIELPGPLDEDGRLVLARRLVREGFLRLLRP